MKTEDGILRRLKIMQFNNRVFLLGHQGSEIEMAAGLVVIEIALQGLSLTFGWL